MDRAEAGALVVHVQNDGPPENPTNQVVLAGAHATYDEDEPAAAIAARVEAELAAEGVTVHPSHDISFEGRRRQV